MEKKAKGNRKSYRDLHGRNAVKPLWKMLPQPVPYAFLIDPTNLCNFRCSFCPTSNPELLAQVGRPKGIMEFSLYQKIIRDLQVLTSRHNRRIVHFQLCKDGEPLLHKRFPEMVRLAKQAEIAEHVEVTTNGALLKKPLILKIIDAGLDVIRISVESVRDSIYAKYSNNKVKYEDIVENVKVLFWEKEAQNSPLHVHAKIIDLGLTDSEKNRFIDDFSGISDSWNIEQPHGWSQSEVHDFTLGKGSKTAVDGMTRKRRRCVCSEPFAKLSINFDGSVSICSIDWSHGTVVGDATRESITEIWNGQRLAFFRMRHLTGQRGTIPACASCDFVEHFPPFADLDDHREELIRVFGYDTLDELIKV